MTVGGTAAEQATSDIPIVFAISSDPVGTGMVASLARPGGNVTGFSIQATDLAGKRLALLREALPALRQLAIMADFGLSASRLELDAFRTAARALGDIEVTKSEITSQPCLVFGNMSKAEVFCRTGLIPKELFRRSADLVDKILRGAKPADLPLRSPRSLI